MRAFAANSPRPSAEPVMNILAINNSVHRYCYLRDGSFLAADRLLVLIVGDLLQPFDRLAVEGFLNGDV